ncbi:MAG TPA: YcnI family protein, partial [Thermoleophilaceae bacterium]|nr:YcnI family protein [Thermoleophilaceae bacterium]
YLIAAALAVPFALAPVAAAHVTLQPEQAPAGGFTRLDVRVPTERDNASTTKVEMRMPPGFLSVSYEPEPGWDVELTMRKLDEPVEQFGERVTEEVGRITFTAQGEANAIGPGEFRDFGLSVAVPEGRPGSMLSFPSLQTYSNGEVVRWIGPPDSEEPAPQVELTAAEEEAAAPPPAEQQRLVAESEDDDGNGLAIAALIVGAAGLAAGLAALLLPGRRARVGAA